MRVHHLNCGTLCPIGGRLFDGRSPLFRTARLACHCLLVETDRGFVLVDTGLGERDIEAPRARLSRHFTFQLRPRLDRAETARAQVERLGVSTRDVRHIVLTHLDFDHAGGLSDFPEANVHVYEDELKAAISPRGYIAKRRYRPLQWDERVRWKTYAPRGERWHGFEAVRNLEGLPPEILLVPLVGHTEGHCGVAVKTPSGWLLHAGDAYFYRDELKDPPYCTPALRLYQRQMAVLAETRLQNQQRLRDLAARSGKAMEIFSSHDIVEFEQRAAAAAAPAPAPRPSGASRYSQSPR